MWLGQGKNEDESLSLQGPYSPTMTAMGTLAANARPTSCARKLNVLSWVDARGAGRLTVLDGVRGLAIALVLLKHGLPDTFVPGGGIVGVDIFFVLSGFVITGTLLRRAQHTEGVRLAGFYGRRAVRLLPALYVMLAVYVAGSVVLHQNVGAAIGAAVASILYYYNFAAAAGVELGNGPLWTLATEEQFYFVWPAVIGLTFMLRARRFGVLLGAAGTLIVVSWVLRAVTWNTVGDAVYTLPSTWTDSLLLGATLALVQVHWPTVWESVGQLLGQGSVQIALWVVIIGSAFIPNMKSEGWVYVWWLAPLGLAMAAALWGLTVRPPSVARAALTSPLAVFLGAVSYSTYLYNFLVFQALQDRLSNWMIVFVLGLAVSIALGTLSRGFVELPPLRLLHRRTTQPQVVP